MELEWLKKTTVVKLTQGIDLQANMRRRRLAV
jgi:hypothetical protein